MLKEFCSFIVVIFSVFLYCVCKFVRLFSLFEENVFFLQQNQKNNCIYVCCMLTFDPAKYTIPK